jgi:hypothetical protein
MFLVNVDRKNEDFYRYAVCAVRIRFLEYASASPMRTPLAGPFLFANAFCHFRKNNSRISSGKPTGFGGQTRSPIRARGVGRHKDCNR